MQSIKTIVLLVAVAISSTSAAKPNDPDPCNYCNPDPCTARPEGLWECCKDGKYQACLAGRINAFVSNRRDVEGCKPGSFRYDNPLDDSCNNQFVFLPFSQGGAGEGQQNLCP